MSTRTLIPLQYGPVDMTLTRPWYVVAGATIAAVWVSIAGVAAAWDAISTLLYADWAEYIWARKCEAVFWAAMMTMMALLGAMLLVLEWRSVFRYSAPMSAMAGVVLSLPALFAAWIAIEELTGPWRGLGLPPRRLIEVVAISLGFSCFTHFRWAALTARWRTRTATEDPAIAERSGDLPSHPPRRSSWDPWCSATIAMLTGVAICYLGAYLSVLCVIWGPENDWPLSTLLASPEFCIWRAYALQYGATDGWFPFILTGKPEGTYVIVSFGAWIPAALAAVFVPCAVYAACRRARRNAWS